MGSHDNLDEYYSYDEEEDGLIWDCPDDGDCTFTYNEDNDGDNDQDNDEDNELPAARRPFNPVINDDDREEDYYEEEFAAPESRRPFNPIINDDDREEDYYEEEEP